MTITNTAAKGHLVERMSYCDFPYGSGISPGMKEFCRKQGHFIDKYVLGFSLTHAAKYGHLPVVEFLVKQNLHCTMLQKMDIC